MQEIKYKEITTSAESDRALALSYYILADNSQIPTRYGARVVENNSGEVAQAADLTTSLDGIRAFVDTLARCAVTPTTLPDVVTDGRARNHPANPEELLRALGVTGTLKGFSYAAHMIEQLGKDPANLALITKCLYPETAKYFGTSAQAVERGLRTLIAACWDRSPRALFNEVAGTTLKKKPTNSEFLDMTAAYLRRHGHP